MVQPSWHLVTLEHTYPKHHSTTDMTDMTDMTAGSEEGIEGGWTIEHQ